MPQLTSTAALQLPINLLETNPTESFTFDFSRMSHFEPFGMLLSGSFIRKYREYYSEIPFFINGANDDSKGYARHMGYFQYLSAKIPVGKAPGEARGSGTYIPITEINIEKLMELALSQGRYLEIGDVIELEAGKLAGILSQNNRELKKLLTYLIREILRNTPEHAECNSMWICGQYWPQRGYAEIAILDEGIGIYNSLIKNRSHAEYIQSNTDALEWSVCAGISSAFVPSQKQRKSDVWSNSGYGLYMVSQICASLGGSFCIVSGDNYLLINSDGREMGKTAFSGTAIQMTLPMNNIQSASSIITEVAKQGENEASTIRNAFKVASRPSKGLIEKLGMDFKP